ncbi:uncharacterized protein LOC125502382 isoform X2 [Dendroctonus ponderosae]
MSSSSRTESNHPSHCSTLASSRTNTVSTFTSRYSCDCDEEARQKLRAVICIKSSLAIFTLLGGAFLALTINVWSRSHANDDDLPNTLYQITANLGTGLCLNSNEYNGLILVNCTGLQNQEQKPFIYDAKAGKVKTEKGCVEPLGDKIDHIGDEQSVYPINVNPCVSDRRKGRGQSWKAWKPSSGSFNLYNNNQRNCLTGLGENQMVILTECSEADLKQRWGFTTPENMRELLYGESRVKEYVWVDGAEKV